MLPLLICALLLPSVALASSSAVATSAIVTTYTSTYHSTSKSFVSTSISITTGGSCNTATVSDGATTTLCIGFANATPVPVYSDVVRTLTSTIESTIGYITIYTTFSDGSASSTGPDSGIQSSIEDVTTSVISNSEIVYNPTRPGGAPATSATRVAVGSSGTSSSTSASATSSTPDSSDNKSSNNVSLKVALAVAIVAGLLVLFLIMGYIIKRRRNKQMKQFIGAVKPDNLEKGGMKIFVAMNKIKKQKVATTTSPIFESMPNTSNHDAETLGANDDDPPMICATLQEHQTRRNAVALCSPFNELEGSPLVKEYSKPNVSAQEPLPGPAVTDQTRASMNAINMKATGPIEADNNVKCTNPFHEPPCSCRQSIVMQPGRGPEHKALGPRKHEVQNNQRYEVQTSPLHETEGHRTFEAQGNPRHEAEGRQRYEAQSNQLYEAQGNPLYEAEGRQLYESLSNPRYEMSATPTLELEGTSVGMTR